MQLPDSDEVCRIVSEKSGGVCLLAFSGGKDAICSWLQCRKHFTRIIPFYQYLIPDLGFVEEGLTYFERYFGTHIVRVPHPSLYRWLNNAVFQPPSRLSVIGRFKLPSFTYETLCRLLREDYDLDQAAPIAIGVRRDDSLQRRGSIKNHGVMDRTGHVFYPVWDWNAARLREELTAAEITLPPDYEMFGRSFDGIHVQYLAPIKEHYPEDYQKILEWVPLAELEVFRYEQFDLQKVRSKKFSL